MSFLRITRTHFNTSATVTGLFDKTSSGKYVHGHHPLNYHKVDRLPNEGCIRKRWNDILDLLLLLWYNWVILSGIYIISKPERVIVSLIIWTGVAIVIYASYLYAPTVIFAVRFITAFAYELIVHGIRITMPNNNTSTQRLMSDTSFEL